MKQDIHQYVCVHVCDCVVSWVEWFWCCVLPVIMNKWTILSQNSSNSLLTAHAGHIDNC